MSLEEHVRPKIAHRRYRGYGRLPQHSHPLVVQLFKELFRQKVSIVDAERKAGLSKNTIYSWRERNGPTLTNFDAALGVLGLELCIREKTGPK